MDKSAKKKYALLIPEYIEDRQALLLCKQIIKFVRRKHYWPTVMELHKLFYNGCNYSLPACVVYTKVCIDKGYLEYDKWKHLRLTDKYYALTNTEPIEPSLPSHALARKKVQEYSKSIKREHKKLQGLGIV